MIDSSKLDAPANSSKGETSEDSDKSPSVLDVMDQKIPPTLDNVHQQNIRQILQCSLCGWGTGLLKPSKANQKLKAHKF